MNNFNKKVKVNEIVVKKVNDFVKKFRFQFNTNQLNVQFKFVSLTNRVQRLFNNYQKVTSIEMSLIQFRSINFFQFRFQFRSIDNDNKKTSLLNKKNNKIFNFKSRTFRFCRHCNENHYDNVCSIQKIMLTKMKNEKNEMFNTIELNDINLKTLQTLKFIQTKNVTNQKKD